MTTTTDLAEFGYRELKMAADLLSAYCDPDRGEMARQHLSDGVTVMMNPESGRVFLTDNDYQVCMMDGDTLRAFYSSPYEGREGFAHELADEYTEMHPEDQEWFRDVANAEGIDLPEL